MDSVAELAEHQDLFRLVLLTHQLYESLKFGILLGVPNCTTVKDLHKGRRVREKVATELWLEESWANPLEPRSVAVYVLRVNFGSTRTECVS